MKAIVTVIGKDKVGIVAGVSAKLAQLGLNIDDISQTVLDEFFTMMAIGVTQTRLFTIGIPSSAEISLPTFTRSRALSVILA